MTTHNLDSFDLGLPGRQSGKVRESWPLPDNRRVLVTTDRLSAFDRIIGTVAHKGQVLNQLAAWWFAQTTDIVDNHVIDVPDPNALLAVDAQPLPVEVIVRGRLTGSTSTSVLPRYLAGERTMYGYELPDGLTPHGPLPTALVTPTTKAEAGGHDEPVTCDEVVEKGLVEEKLWDQVQQAALALFARGVEVADDAGFVLADTKYEFGLDPSGKLVVIDEMHTPDSSRFWAKETLEARLADDKVPESFDKEPVRLALRAAGYKGEGQPPELDDEVWSSASSRYVEIYERLSGVSFVPGDRPIAERIHKNLSSLVSAPEQ